MNKVAVVTGAGRGIGAATVAALNAAGWLIVAVDLDHSRSSERAGVALLEGDVCEQETHVRATHLAHSLGALKGWVNNAAIQLSEPTEHLTEAAVRRQVDVNVLGTIWGFAAAASHMAAAGSVVSIASIHAVRGFPHALCYAGTKGAIVSMARQFAAEHGSRGLRSNSISPGAILTDMCVDDWETAADPRAAREADESLHPMHRMGEVHEIANVVEFLLSDRASLINGQDLKVDGGATARPPGVHGQ